MGLEELFEGDKKIVVARSIQRFLSQPLAEVEQSTGMKGAPVKLETISSFERLV